MPNRYFGDYEELREAALAMTDAAVAAERAKYPRMARHLHATHGSCAKCDVCGSGDVAKAAFLSMSWRHVDDRYVQACAAHAYLLDHPVELLRAIAATAAA